MGTLARNFPLLITSDTNTLRIYEGITVI